MKKTNINLLCRDEIRVFSPNAIHLEDVHMEKDKISKSAYLRWFAIFCLVAVGHISVTKTLSQL